ncbi:MAG: cob(I)yrinic acid a,c-diamide adenosyltransferase [Gammaproteobacteria bacterium]|nr:cob(I)yrinic acid a,c-diamide adenosyltransferase [Gammaproteobacteria bacterium]MDH5800783.1 cob(I)yrinic acid a,c-diamide adenosyltransferase [Gammaproteobacteria bacterium]
MGNRLSKIVTKTGDQGETGLGDGSRVSKNHARVEALGDVDELNSSLGVLLNFVTDAAMSKLLLQIQHHCFDLGGELSMPDTHIISAAHTHFLETSLEHYNSTLPPLKEFILPGGNTAASFCHLSRAISRRTERRVIALSQLETVSPHVKTYLNRLSDLLFVLARNLNHQGKNQETYWHSQRATT